MSSPLLQFLSPLSDAGPVELSAESRAAYAALLDEVARASEAREHSGMATPPVASAVDTWRRLPRRCGRWGRTR